MQLHEVQRELQQNSAKTFIGVIYSCNILIKNLKNMDLVLRTLAINLRLEIVAMILHFEDLGITEDDYLKIN